MTGREVIQTDCVVIGAGVVGLAVARELSSAFEVILFEKNGGFGEEASSRNSEVIHSGIYYPENSKKTELCIKGRTRLYSFCEEANVPFRKLGKYLIATSVDENGYLEKKADHCKSLDVPFRRLSRAEAREKLSGVRVESALFFPETGIVDSHVLMQRLESKALNQSATLLYQQQVKSVERMGGRWRLEITSPGDSFSIDCKVLVNAGGINAAEISNRALQTQRYEHRFCRGRYFAFNGSHPFSTLVYPVPPKDGLGVHVTLDLSGALRLGPDVDWSLTPSYDCNWEALRKPFASAAQKYWPNLDESALTPGLIGIRPKLFVDGLANTDFLIEETHGFIHCLGIESPGLTSALAIAENVSKLIEQC